MSAIYGAIDFLKKQDFSGLAGTWKASYDSYKIDRHEQIIEQGFLMGCGIQYFYKEAEKEVLPAKSGELIFTADCALDNRSELISILGIDNDSADGAIILEAYKKWKYDCVKHLRGAFSFVVYDSTDNKVFMAVDHFAQRCLMYHVRDGVLYFSTTVSPLVKDAGLTFSENERWLVDCISIRGPIMMLDPKETAFMDVNKVVSGTYVVVDGNKDCEVTETRYFDPINTYPTDKKITREQSEIMIKEVMNRVVKGILRDGDNVGTQLSCGLDSSSVACVAAGQLAAKGKQLRSYTSIPIKEAGLKNKGGLIYDESEGVKEICNAYPNIIPTFIDCAGHDYLNEVDKYVNVWELPCKSQQNTVWTLATMMEAHNDGCKIMLSGATGNCTLSAGNIESTAYNHLRSLHLIKAYHTFDAVKNIKVSRKRYLGLLKGSIKEYFKWYFDKDMRDFYKYTVTKRNFGERYECTKRLNKEKRHYFPFYSMKEMRNQMYMVLANAQIGEIDTKMSLESGVLTRDPMRSVDMMELCFSLPVDCFASSDYDRRLVRVGMKGIVPEKIRLDVLHRGRQSGDHIYRSSQIWDDVKADIYKSLMDEKVLKYLDKDKLEELFNKLNKDNLEDNALDFLMIVDAYSFSRYLNLYF